MGTKVVYNSRYGGFSLSLLAKEWMRKRGVPDEFNLPRHHPLLVECVETLGMEASGARAALYIIEVPGNQYAITEHDGAEHVECPEEYGWMIVAPGEIETMRAYCDKEAKRIREIELEKEIAAATEQLKELEEKRLKLMQQRTHLALVEGYRALRIAFISAGEIFRRMDALRYDDD